MFFKKIGFGLEFDKIDVAVSFEFFGESANQSVIESAVFGGNNRDERSESAKIFFNDRLGLFDFRRIRQHIDEAKFPFQVSHRINGKKRHRKCDGKNHLRMLQGVPQNSL